jgi:hypothetical protein
MTTADTLVPESSHPRAAESWDAAGVSRATWYRSWRVVASTSQTRGSTTFRPAPTRTRESTLRKAHYEIAPPQGVREPAQGGCQSLAVRRFGTAGARMQRFFCSRRHEMAKARNQVRGRHGGSRPGAGRPRTVPELEPASDGEDKPIAYLLRVMRNGTIDPRRRDAAARAVLGYLRCHPSALDERDPVLDAFMRGP